MALMSIPAKSNSLQSYAMLLYRRAVHPEFFGIEGRKRLEHGTLEAEAWIFKGGHAVRFQSGALTMCEVVVDHPTNLPERGLAANLPCAGERDHEEKLTEEISFMTTIQTETMPEHLYLSTYKEMLVHGRSHESLMSVWTDDQGKPNLSVLDMQRYRSEIHVQGYHLRSDCALVLRTQSMLRLPRSAAVRATPRS